MHFLTKIKLGSVTNLSDARYAAAAGMDYIGFCFDPARPSYIPPVKAKEIIDWVSGINIVGEFGEQSLNDIRSICDLLRLDIAEIDNSLSPAALLELGIPVIKKIDLDEHNEAQVRKLIMDYGKAADAFLLYSAANHFDAQADLLKSLCAENNIVWGLPVDTDNLTAIIHDFKPMALNLTGSSEEKAGLKDFDALNELMEKITAG